MEWYTEDDISVMPAWVTKDNIIDLQTFTVGGGYSETTSRRWSVIDRRDDDIKAKIISVSYKYGFDSFNYRHQEVLNKYKQGEYVALISMTVSELQAGEWNGSVGDLVNDDT